MMMTVCRLSEKIEVRGDKYMGYMGVRDFGKDEADIKGCLSSSCTQMHGKPAGRASAVCVNAELRRDCNN